MPAERVTSNSPWHLVLVLDNSGSMAGVAATKLNELLDTMLEEMKLISMGTKPYFKLSIIVFGSNVQLLAEGESEKIIDKMKITSFKGDSGGTNMAAALNEAAAVLKRKPGNPTDFEPYILLLTDGHPDNESAALKAAQAIRDMEVAAGKPHLVAIGLGDGVNMDFLRQVATNPELVKHLQKPEDLNRLFPVIGTLVTGEGGSHAVDQAIIDL